MLDLCQGMLDQRGMPDEWALQLSKELEVKVGKHQACMLLPLVRESVRNGLMSEMLYAADLRGTEGGTEEEVL